MSAGDGVRQHGRLESFLQRALGGEAAARVSRHQRCLVATAARPAPALAALSDSRLYVVDDPPRRLTAALALADVTDVQMVHEKPLFLKGPDRERSQHIQVTYAVRNPHLPERNNPIRSASRLQGSCSRASSCNASAVTAPPGATTDCSKRRKLRKLLSSLSWPRRGSEEPEGGPLRSVSVLDFGEDPAGSERSSVRSLWPFSTVAVGEVVVGPRAEVLFESESEVSSPVSRHGGWFRRGRPEILSPELLTTETSSLVSPRMRSSALMTPRSRTVLGNYGDHGSVLFRRTQPKSSGGTIYEDMDIEGEIHIYILEPQSTFFSHLNTAWQSRLIKETLELNEVHQRQIKNNEREHCEQVLQDLHRQLLRKSEDSFVHIRLHAERQLKDIGNSTFIKKIFWKDPNLFPAVVSKIHTLVLAPDNLEDQNIGFTMDKIKACTSLIRILADLLRDTETSFGRSRHLAYRNGQRTKTLITTLINTPWLPLANRDVTMAVVTSSDYYASRDWESFVEAPLIRSVVDLTNISSMVLHQFFQLSIQSFEENFNQKPRSILWMVKIISEVKAIDTYISRVMCQLLFFTGSPDNFPLTPFQSVVLHQQLSLLNTFMSHSTSLALQITLMFGEEIRYFVIRQVIEKKVPPHYAIRPSLLSLVDSLRQAVLERRAASITQLLSFSNTL